ncbi:bifunctional precorrin-2 dehydrogenase/sirohydrochlorin ferrochelatase [Geobacillus sp. TFV-3]|uniref:precorrin-2 dehydrogenase/sirohydrochlorin ferrochelatase family protein n=1 Tax=Geobacillus sp. TFV-3 TaxID=1897059 RepID=UPI001358F30C|nr:NAD(P)-dependent oxidoreductase [Geobacillus sp. TFV-3]KAF0993884.1 Precorrin-2 dehydrogenase [Geobacillus sp. TFV-3]
MGYPVILHLRGRRVVVVGGGKVAARKIHGLLEAGAEIVMIAPEAEPELQALAAGGMIVWKKKRFDPDDLAGAFLVIAATNDRKVNEAVAQAAPGQLVNVVDDPERCDFHVPAVVRRGALTIAVSTGGASPALARRIRRELEEKYGEEYGPYLEFLQRARGIVLREVEDAEGRKRLFQALAADSFRQSGRWEEEFTRLLAKEKERNKEGERGR